MRKSIIRQGLCIAGLITLAGMGRTRILAADNTLVLKATFDQENADDSSGKGNHGTVVGTPEFTEGVLGKAIHLTNPDGVAGEYKEARQYVNFGEPDDLKFGTGDFSVLFWYKSDGADPEEVAVIGNKDWNSGGNEGLAIADFRDGMGLNFTAAGEGRLDTDRVSAATDNEWHHIAAVFDRDDVMSLYVDGEKMSEKDIKSRAGKTIDVTDFVLGADGFKRFGVKDSYIDELLVYKKAFTKEEIQEMDAPYRLLKTIEEYEDILKNSDASADKKKAFETVLAAVKREAGQAEGIEEVQALLKRLSDAYYEFSKPEKGIVEFEVLSDVHIRQDNDTETNSANFIDALLDINDKFPDTLGVMNSGDFSDSGNENQYSGYFSVIERFGGEIPAFMTALGNHDVRWKSGWDEVYERYMRHNQEHMGDTDGKVYFDKWLGGYHFLVLNTEWDLKDRAYISEEQIKWLDAKIAENGSEDKPVFLFLHQAMRDTYFNSNDWDVGVQDHEMKEVLRKYPNVILFTGHIHNGLGACDVIETDYGAMVDVPAFYSNDYGDSRGQLGYHVTVYEDKVLLSMYDYKNDVFMPEYSHTILLKGRDWRKSKMLEVNFDDGTADDISGNGHNGTVAGEPEFVKGIKGKAIRLANDESVAGAAQKARQYVDFGKADSLRLGTDDFSVLFWYKGSAASSGDYSIFSNKNWDTGANLGFTVGSFEGGNRGMCLNFTAEGGSRADTGRFEQALDGNWHMIAATFDRDGEMTLYIDGKKAGSTDISGQQGSIDVDGLGLVLGADGNMQYGVKDACVDELSVYKALLGPGEVESAYYPYTVEVTADSAEIVWQADGVTEPAYVLLNGGKRQDIASGAGRILLNSLEPDTEYDVLVVTREVSHTGNYKDAFEFSICTEPLVAPEAQKKMLAAVYNAYAGFDMAAYTKDSANALKMALALAAGILQQERATEQEVQEAADAVLKAAASLIPDTAGLEKELLDAKALAQEREEARKKAEAALAQAKEAEKEALSAKEQAEFTSAGVTLRSVKKSGKKGVVVSWKKVDGAEGYVVEYATNAKFKKPVKATAKGGAIRKTIKKLKSGKKYYFRIRAYRTVDGKRIYTKYSVKKQIKL